MLYSKSTRGFYDRTVHGGKVIPKDAVEISRDEYVALLQGQNEGRVIEPGKDGRPMLSDQATTPTSEPAPIEKLKLFLSANPDIAELLK